MKKARLASFVFCWMLFYCYPVFALSGEVSGTWTADSPITVDGDVEILSGNSLVIEPGVRIEFTGPFTFSVYGSLEAVGTGDNPIVFTRAFPTDDSRWGGVRFDNALDASILEYCTIEYVYKNGSYPGVRGGGLWINGCSPVIRYCTLVHNYCRNENYNGTGGGISLNGNSNSVIDNNIIQFNVTDSGGGIHIGNGCHPVIRNNLIRNNESYYSGGGIYLAAWGHAVIYNNRIQNNQCYGWAGGGGITLWNGNCSDTACTEVFNNIIAHNTASTYGGGIYSRYNDSRIYNNTIVYNSAASGGGLHVLNQGNTIPLFFNGIFWGNTAPSGAQIYLYPDTGSQALVMYCDVQGGFSGVANIDADPLFVDPSNDDYRVQGGSACIDAGTNDVVSLPDVDFSGISRRIDDPDTPDTGSGQAPVVDMGAHEFYGLICLWDLDGDHMVDSTDVDMFAVDFGALFCAGPCPADFDTDNDIDAHDLVNLALAFNRCQ